MHLLFVLYTSLIITAQADNPLKKLFGKDKKSNVTTTDSSIVVKIFSNFAEIVRKISSSELPVEFSDEEWNELRADTITLYGPSIDVTSQTISEKKKSMNGEKIYVRRSNGDKIDVVEAVMIDEKKNLVQDTSKKRYFTVGSDQIEHISTPPTNKHVVSFTYKPKPLVSDQQWYLTYLRSNLNWKTRYNLLLDEQKSQLISLADIRNDGEKSLTIESAELFGGDINIQVRPSRHDHWAYANHYPRLGRVDTDLGDTRAKISSAPTISRPEELAGLYVYNIDKPFTIESKTNYILPMAKPTIKVDRFCSIAKSFHATNNRGKAQRSYRLHSDQFLTKGNAIIRESDHLVGEANWPDIAANDDYDFSIGEDPDVTYKENVTRLSSKILDESAAKRLSGKQYYVGLIVTQSLYEINLQLKNFKKRPIKLEYTQRFHGSKQFTVQEKGAFTQEGNEIHGHFTLPANKEKDYKYKVEVTN
ncbi:unnamed protein product [Didymodactylos carnosus]|uniref:DUF4139 domain-containing protein n=1 Tax=Didymodactylos carnosus TaxID=1234261 RepID=A0A814J963_9BILA|nr:unnamed protein product [Didymodactylos carnosus]CAF1034305.1 unnamed protein product [Didymodactylos carnosus]CAF3716700.1 unnamed protein product [Didymodactylos carnosus]CAF3804966.1 unnamed protein product [Didymodactylos carnosus]